MLKCYAEFIRLNKINYGLFKAYLLVSTAWKLCHDWITRNPAVQSDPIIQIF